MNVAVNINGQDASVPAGINVIEACALVGVEVPHFCYHPKLALAGSCRMCLCSIGTPMRDRATGELILDEGGKPKIGFMPKPAIACGTTVSEGMHVVTNSKEICAAREGVMEFILANHPLDCPICDKAGECKLQEYAQANGNQQTRFVEAKNAKPKKQKIGAGKIVLDAERCILCSRCIRYCKEKLGREILGFTKRGSKTEIAVFDKEDGGDNYLVNVADICPVGALTESAFRFKMRTWFLRTANSISTQSSVGVNTKVWARGDKIYRITPRENKAVNDVWMPDNARLEYLSNSEGRLSTMRIDGNPCGAAYAIARAEETLSLEGIAIVASAFQSFEEQFLLSELANLCGAKVYAVSHLGESDGKLISADRTPNMRGLFVSGLINEYPKADLSDLVAELRAGNVKNVLCFEENLLELGFEEKDFKLANVIYCGTKDSQTAKLAKVAIALESVFEKSGLFINRQFRIQSFEKVVPALEGTENALTLLMKLVNSLGHTEFSIPDLSVLREQICKKSEYLPDGCTISEEGLVLEASKFANINFPDLG